MALRLCGSSVVRPSWPQRVISRNTAPFWIPAASSHVPRLGRGLSEALALRLSTGPDEPARACPTQEIPDKFSDGHRVDESASTVKQQRISAMDRETEARWERVIVEENPAFSRLMGVRFTSGSRDRIEAELTVGEDLANRNGVMHGGAIMAFADILGG